MEIRMRTKTHDLSLSPGQNPLLSRGKSVATTKSNQAQETQPEQNKCGWFRNHEQTRASETGCALGLIRVERLASLVLTRDEPNGLQEFEIQARLRNVAKREWTRPRSPNAVLVPHHQLIWSADVEEPLSKSAAVVKIVPVRILAHFETPNSGRLVDLQNKNAKAILVAIVGVDPHFARVLIVSNRDMTQVRFLKAPVLDLMLCE